MLAPFLSLAMISPTRQSTFRLTVALHICVVATAVGAVLHHNGSMYSLTFLGHLLIVAGIVEGAALFGWRMTQLPKSQALEFLLVSPVQPQWVFLAEAFVGILRLTLVTLSGVPILLWLLFTSQLGVSDILWLLAVPYSVALFTGVGLTAWAYEALWVRRIGEIVGIVGVLVYLVVGVLAAEKLGSWVRRLPSPWNSWVYNGVIYVRDNNPFSALEHWLHADDVRWVLAERLWHLETVLLGLTAFGLVRAAYRLKGHFHDRHYRPLSEVTAGRSTVGNRPLSWWAVRRVMEYSGRTNLWLAGGFALLYATYILYEKNWPSWIGRGVFIIFENDLGGVAGLTTALMLLAAVPAAFQYGLWDPSTQDRCRRLELLLLTDLDDHDYWHAAAAAAWRRGGGYVVVASILWGAAWWAGRADGVQVLASLTAGVILWSASFVLGFRAFASGMQANGLGTVLTLGLPLAVFGLYQLGLPDLVPLLPPGAVFAALHRPPDWTWGIGPFLVGLATLYGARTAQRQCMPGLRAWYDANQGKKLLD
jgi:hypothetical protein